MSKGGHILLQWLLSLVTSYQSRLATLCTYPTHYCPKAFCTRLGLGEGYRTSCWEDRVTYHLPHPSQGYASGKRADQGKGALLVSYWADRDDHHKATSESQAGLGSRMAPLWNEGDIYPIYVRAEDLGV